MGRHEQQLETLAAISRLLAARSGQRQLLAAVLEELEHKLDMRRAINHWKAAGLDFSRILDMPKPAPGGPVRRSSTGSSWTPANVFSSRWTRWKYHGLTLIAVGLVARSRPRRLLHVAAAAFTAGVLIFSGCLYAYVLTGAKPWAMIVPVGGLLLLLGWLGVLMAMLLPPAATVNPNT